MKGLATQLQRQLVLYLRRSSDSDSRPLVKLAESLVFNRSMKSTKPGDFEVQATGLDR